VRGFAAGDAEFAGEEGREGFAVEEEGGLDGVGVLGLISLSLWGKQGEGVLT